MIHEPWKSVFISDEVILFNQEFHIDMEKNYILCIFIFSGSR